MVRFPCTRLAISASGFIIATLTILCLANSLHREGTSIAQAALVFGVPAMIGAAIASGWAARWSGRPGLLGWANTTSACLATMLAVSIAMATLFVLAVSIGEARYGDQSLWELIGASLLGGLMVFPLPLVYLASGPAVPVCIAAVHLIAKWERRRAVERN
jgi:hypothetical protein